ncbi:hypothetical protein BRAS3809_1160012 [Bradyrhizobium sp. STM 3809]|nr:hypothetical protein BRAS3809_1160012 [Bradyrhizobium sp. STM 3809]
MERVRYHSIIDAFFETIIDLETDDYGREEILRAATDFFALYTHFDGGQYIAIEKLQKRAEEYKNKTFPTNREEGWKYRWYNDLHLPDREY